MFRFNLGKSEDELKVVVPPKQVLDRLPLFSTPLTIESTNNAFLTFYKTLKEMGFEEQAEAALIHTNAESVELVSFKLHICFLFYMCRLYFMCVCVCVACNKTHTHTQK